MTSQNTKPLTELQRNTSSFFNQFYEKHQAHMQCKMECSQCCHTDFSIFEVEASAILQWVKNLDVTNQQTLLQLLTQPEQTSVYNGKKACVFLRDDKCSIYDARPIICRTQGLVLQYKVRDNKDKSEVYADVCPLNFSKEENFPEQRDWLDLDRLNSLQSIAENFYQKSEEEKENFSKNQEGRAELSELKDKIVRMLIEL